METKSKCCPLSSGEAKATFADYIGRKQVIRELALAWGKDRSDEDITNIIKKLSLTYFCANPREAVLQLVK